MADAYSGNGRVDALEQRVHRLEDAVAAFEDTHQLEERVVARVTDRLQRNPPLPGETRDSLLVEGRRLLPALVSPPVTGQSWILVEAYRDVRAIFRMFVDPRYRVSRGVSLVTLCLCIAIAFSWFWPTVIPIVGGVIAKLFELVLIFFLFKMLTREAKRYRAMIPEGSSPPR
jgi:hypothetical protein